MTSLSLSYTHADNWARVRPFSRFTSIVIIIIIIMFVYYPNVTTLRSGLCYRKSVCLSVVCNAGAPYSGGRRFRQYFFIAVYLSRPLTSVQNFTDIVPGEPLRRGIKHKKGIAIPMSRSGISSPGEFLVDKLVRTLIFTYKRKLSYTRRDIIKICIIN